MFFGDITSEKNRTLVDVSAREHGVLATIALVILWMGIGSPFITRRTAAATQTVMDQAEPQWAYEAARRVQAKPQPKNVSSYAAQSSVERLGIR